MDMKKLFGIDRSHHSHDTLYIAGIKIKILKSSIRNNSKLYNTYKNAEEIPKATGILRDVQMGNLTLIKIFDKFCKENNLQYWIDFGTLLGAVRHKGFIPWDDDIDLGMLRDDYEKLIELLSQIDHPYLRLDLARNKPYQCFVKVRYKGLRKLFIDVFPYDMYYAKTDAQEKIELHNKITKLVKKLKYTSNVIKDKYVLREKFKTITQHEILQDRVCRKVNKPSIFWAIDFPHDRWKNRVYDWENIFPVKKIPFEDTEVFCPNNPDFVLKNVYGDYMKIPERIYPGHVNISGVTEEDLKIIRDFIKEANV